MPLYTLKLDYKLKILLWLTLLIIINGSSYCQAPITTLKQLDNQLIAPKEFQKEVVKLQSKHWNKGYLDFQIDSIDAMDREIHFNKGEKYFWGDITFNDSLTFTASPKGIISPKAFTTFNNSLLSNYKDNGFPFVDISLESDILEYQINIHYKILKGTYITFDTINISDTNIQNIKYLQNLTQIKPKHSYDESKLKNLKSTINSSGIYQYKNHALKFYSNKAQLAIELTENKINAFSGFIGLQPNSENKTNLTGQVTLDLTNTFNQGEDLSFHWKKNSAHSQLLDAAVKLPFIINSPIGVLGSVYIDQQDSTFSNTILQGGLSFYLSNATFCSAEGRYVKSTINYPSTTNTQSVLFGIGYLNKKANRIFNPSKGFKIELNSFAGKRTIKHIDIQESYLRFDYKVQLEAFIPIGKNTIRIANHTSGIQSDSLNQSELPRIGGIQSLRGFDENVIFAKQYNISTVEYRYILDEFSNLFIFCDYGISQEIANRHWAFVNRVGFGTGLNINTKAGLLSVAYAFGKEKNNPIKLNQSKIHIGYVARF